jgi:hypothetical protein
LEERALDKDFPAQTISFLENLAILKASFAAQNPFTAASNWL